MNFRENLKKYRKRTGYTAKEFANIIDLPYTTYTAYENQDREPKFSTLIKIADALHVSIDELLGHKLKPINPLEKAMQYFRNIGYIVEEKKIILGDNSSIVIFSPGFDIEKFMATYQECFTFKNDELIIKSENSHRDIAVFLTTEEIILLYKALTNDEKLSKEIKAIQYNQAFSGFLIKMLETFKSFNKNYSFYLEHNGNKKVENSKRTDVILKEYLTFLGLYNDQLIEY